MRKRTRTVGFVLVPDVWDDTRVEIPGWAGSADAGPGGVELGTVPFAPAARDAFTPAELEERIARHAERVARDDPREPAVACGGCGAVPPKLSHVRAIPGWRLEEVPGAGGSRPANVIWCPACVAVERGAKS